MEECYAEKETPIGNGIYINGINYSYKITKSNKNKDVLNIKLYDKNKISKIYFTYESHFQEIKKKFEFFSFTKNIDDIISYLNEIFSKGKIEIKKENDKNYIILKINDDNNKVIFPLTKNKIKYELDNRIDKLEKNYENLVTKFDELISAKEKEIKNKIIEVMLKQDIKGKLFEEMEQMFLSKYNLNNISKNNNVNKEQNSVNKEKKVFDNKEDKINKEIILLQKQLKENIEYLNKMKPDKNNYITLQVKIDKNNINKDIILFNQVRTYKYFCNFERDDIETIIDNEMVSINFKNSYKDFKCDKDSKNCEKSQEIYYNLNIKYKYYWNFHTEGEHTVKIIFKKKLLQSNWLFYDCDSIYKIDCSKFDCSQIINCSGMFYHCSALSDINLGELDFSLSNNFSYMFYNCKNLEKVDISNLKTKYSLSFNSMFKDCWKLKKINVSKFKTKNCEDIGEMFLDCKSLESIDMINWDMKNINNIECLFSGCSNLKNIKMNFNNKNPKCFEGQSWGNNTYDKLQNVFSGLPENGTFIGKKGIDCSKLLQHLPKNWNKIEE